MRDRLGSRDWSDDEVEVLSELGRIVTEYFNEMRRPSGRHALV